MPITLTAAPNVTAIEDAGRTIHLKDHRGDLWYDDDGKPVTATIAGLYSLRYTTAKGQELERGIKAGKRVTGKDFEASSVRLDAALVIDWDLRDGDRMVDPIRVFAVWPFVREQITQEASDHAGFFETTSSTP